MPEAPAFEFFRLALGLDLLDVGAVLQHDAEEVRRGRRAIDRPGETVGRERREQARMVHVGMGEDDEIHGLWPVGREVAVALLDGPVALMHAAVDAEARGAGLDHVAGAGDGARGAEKLDLHHASR